MRWRQDDYLFVIGAVAFAAATIGREQRCYHRAGDSGHILGMGTAYTAMLTAFYVEHGLHLPLWDHLPTWRSGCFLSCLDASDHPRGDTAQHRSAETTIVCRSGRIASPDGPHED